MRESPALRDALVAAMLPAPGRNLPAASELDLSGFWARFELAAPLHLRLAFRSATVLIAGVLPFALGYRRTLAKLDADKRDEFLGRAAKMPGIGQLFDIVKIVVAFAYFDDPRVAAIVRGSA